MYDKYSSQEFESAYTYDGCDLGAVWSKDSTRFRLWAPTAQAVWVNLYQTGTPDASDIIKTVPMRPDVKGTWIAEIEGDLNGVYYTFMVNVNRVINEACDPYARTTGVNGQRAMVIDLASTDPEGWAEDCNPNPLQSITDAVIYELHVRDLSSDKNSGIKNKGKFLGLIETGTKTPGGEPTGLDHIKSLGINYLHLLPVFDYGSVDESIADNPQYNWGYDPVNFNVPEGSYSTDPFHGEVRVKEMKQMIKGLHDNGISVIMDVVYNHVFKVEEYCFNKIVPDYFSRKVNGKFTNGSGCGNDTASERSMVRKYIIDSVCYWADEYHIDGFRFDLVGLIDVDTLNAVMKEVHKKHPDVIFYGEGWTLNTTPTKPCQLAVQSNSKLTPGFAYFNDTLRDLLRGSVFRSEVPGFVGGVVTDGEQLDACFRGLPHWCHDPAQTVNYVSCHDNNTLLDRISLSAPNSTLAEKIRMNRLAAAFYMTAQGIPFLQAGEEMLRSKPNGKGGYIDNSYKSPDEINSLKWLDLEKTEYHQTVDYYKGLIAFRKAHPVLRMNSTYDILSNLVPVHVDHPQIAVFRIRGEVYYEPADELIFIFSASKEPRTFSLPEGPWHICINGDKAGTASLGVAEGSITVPPVTAMVLVKGSLDPREVPLSTPEYTTLDSLSGSPVSKML